MAGTISSKQQSQNNVISNKKMSSFTNILPLKLVFRGSSMTGKIFVAFVISMCVTTVVIFLENRSFFEEKVNKMIS